MRQENNNGIWRFEGSKPGSCVVILGGVHGNELTGIQVVERLRDQFNSGELKLQQGILYLVLGNLEAIKINERATNAKYDLNRLFTEANLSGEPRDFYESRRAKELAVVLSEADIAIDLHATNKPSEPFLCVPEMNPKYQRVLRWFAAERVLVDPDHILVGEGRATEEYAHASGGVGVCYETGWVEDTSRVGDVIKNVLGLLTEQGFIFGNGADDPGEFKKEIYQPVEAVILSEDGFSFAKGRGEISFEPFKAHEVLGYVGEKKLIVDYNGVLIFPKIKKHWVVGLPVCFLAQKKIN